VKGAYWDTEIKRAQERGLDGYPVFTRKVATDVSYLACAKSLLEARALRPAFATHNALTVATVLEWARERRDFEFQRLHGMGDGLYEPLLKEGYACRVYAPVGPHRDLLAYLVRRLLENGANTSFVHQLGDENSDIALLADPVQELERLSFTPHPRIPLPVDLYLPQRKNSHGVDFSDRLVVAELLAEIENTARHSHEAAALVSGAAPRSDRQPIELRDPADRRRTVGLCYEARPTDVEDAITIASARQESWSREAVEKRAAILERAADSIERHRSELMYFAIREAGKTLPDAIAEVREAADFCRYYAACARASFKPMPLPGPTGESNEMYLAGRGPFACISPWNFPLAIFTGQVVAALVSGNTVLAKPAPQTPLMAHRAVQLLHEAGVPTDVLHLLPGGVEVGRALTADPRIRGVVFTGSTATARGIASTLAAKEGPLVPFIAETGGQNAIIVDSSALPEQVVADILTSGFQSAGQRCSALRVLWLQDEIAPRVLEMLQGAMNEWVVGDPMHLRTDVGPAIDERARDKLEAYVQSGVGRVLYRMRLTDECAHGCFIAPTLLEMSSPSEVVGEVFGPIVHVLRWKAKDLDVVISAINRSGYGLTLGIHSRIGNTVEYIRERVHVGNIYVNRSMIGAVVGAQPFGGEGLSGTGPKAGGPHYLLRFATERTVSIDTTSAGGNATLMSL
jgi:RHH-type proline utilization regulon transcriptional repressor/proline dehydrogenase/delta 1-pyrroline-5-carboxylate dehydrogenase